MLCCVLRRCVVPRQQKDGIFYNAMDYRKVETSKKVIPQNLLLIIVQKDWRCIKKSCWKKDVTVILGFCIQMELKEYLEILATTNVDRLSYDEGLAFMINAYNAFTVDVIIENNPKNSIRDLSSFFRGSVFR